MTDGGYDEAWTPSQHDLLNPGADEPDDFDPALEEWEGVTSENIGGADTSPAPVHHQE